jgi:hypothetical protein
MARTQIGKGYYALAPHDESTNGEASDLMVSAFKRVLNIPDDNLKITLADAGEAESAVVSKSNEDSDD